MPRAPRRHRMRSAVVAVAVAVLAPLALAGPARAGDDPVEETVVGELVQAWAEPGTPQRPGTTSTPPR